jgi:hypothetical protein
VHIPSSGLPSRAEGTHREKTFAASVSRAVMAFMYGRRPWLIRETPALINLEIDGIPSDISTLTGRRTSLAI